MAQIDPLMIAVLKLYCTHRRYFSLEYHQKFKLFACWILESTLDVGYEVCPANSELPWYRTNWNLSELAKILKISEQELLGTLEEIYNDY